MGKSLSVAGVYKDGAGAEFSKTIKTDSDGNIGSFLKTKDFVGIPTTLTAPNTWVYSAFIDTDGFSKISAIANVVAPEVEVYLDFSADGVKADSVGTVYKAKPNTGGAIPFDTPTIIDSQMRYVRFRVRHTDVVDRSVKLNIRMFNVSSFDKTPNLISYISSKTGGKETVQGNGGSVKTSGMVMMGYVDKNSNHTMIFSQPMNGFCILNQGESDLTVTINGMVIRVLAGALFRECFVPYTVADVKSTVPYMAWGLL